MGRYYHLTLTIALAALLTACGSSSTTVVSPSGSADRCAVTVAATTTTIAPTGGSGSVTVDTARECQWTATADAAWLSLPSGTSGQGPNTISYVAAANSTSTSRRASITVNGQRIEILQESAACAVSLQQQTFAVGASGGVVGVPFTAQSSCTWTAVSRASWIVVTSDANGSGDGEIVLSVAANTGASRSEVVDIAGQEVTVTQAAAPAGCSFAIDPASRTVGADPSQLTVTVTASPNCAWAAISESPWIAVTSGAAGVGNGPVVLQVSANSGAFRIGSVTIAGRTYSVTQSAAPGGCSYTVAPPSQNVPASGGTTSATVSTSGACAWSTTGVPSWISVAGGNGSGNGTVNFTAQANTGAARAVTMTIAGQSFTINQAAAAGSPCTFTLNPTSHSPAAAGGATSVAVTTAAGCGWSTTGLPSWITFTSGNGSGTGNGTVSLTVAANTGAPRGATLTIAGQPFPVNQASGTPACTYALNPTSFDAPAAGEATTVAVTTTSSCSWTTTGVPTWITVVNNSGAGSGNGTVRLQIAANTGTARSQTMTIGGQSYTVNQAAPCSYTLNPTSFSVAVGGGSTTVAVTTATGCSWSTTGLPSWINFTNGNGTGNGNGAVSITVQPNTGAARTVNLTIAGQQFTVSQAAIPCAYTVSPRSFDLDKNSHTGGNAVSIGVQTTSGCAWTASVTSGSTWMTIRAGATGLGNGTVLVDVEANDGPARTGTLTVAGQSVIINQEKK